MRDKAKIKAIPRPEGASFSMAMIHEIAALCILCSFQNAEFGWADYAKVVCDRIAERCPSRRDFVA